MNIVQLKAENVKRLSAVSITPEGNVITVGGANGAGKSSVLDSIAYALGGKSLIPEEPIRRGETSAKVVVDLGDLIVTRTFSRIALDNGEERIDSKLVVTNKDGAAYPSPQAMIDKLLGELTFDPLEFAGHKPAIQRDTLRQLVNLDTSMIDEQHKEAYVSRTHFNRVAMTQKAQVEGMPHFEGVPEVETPLSAISEKLTAADEARAQLRAAENVLGALARDMEAIERREVDLTRERDEAAKRLAELNSLIESTKAEAVGAERKAKDQEARVKAMTAALPDTAALQAEIDEIEGVNFKVRANAARAAALAALDETKAKAKALDDKIVELAEAKGLMLQRVKYPVPGLGLTDDGVTFNDIPLNQASTAEQLRVSVAIGLALNPKLKVLLVRNGNALDSKSMKMVADMAQEAGAQIWMERVAESSEGISVMIEDGHVAG